MTPLASPFGRRAAGGLVRGGGGRLFCVGVGARGPPGSRPRLVELAGKSDPLIGDALQSILERGDFIPSLPDASPAGAPAGGAPAPIETDPAIVTDLIGRNQESIAALKRDIRSKSGSSLFDFILTDIQELRRILFDRQSHAVFMSAMGGTWRLDERLEEWPGEENAADTLAQSGPHNRTSEMG